MKIIQLFRKILPGVNQFQPRLREVVELDHERALADRELEERRQQFDESLDLLLADFPRRRKLVQRKRGHQ